MAKKTVVKNNKNKAVKKPAKPQKISQAKKLSIAKKAPASAQKKKPATATAASKKALTVKNSKKPPSKPAPKKLSPKKPTTKASIPQKKGASKKTPASKLKKNTLKKPVKKPVPVKTSGKKQSVPQKDSKKISGKKQDGGKSAIPSPKKNQKKTLAKPDKQQPNVSQKEDIVIAGNSHVRHSDNIYFSIEDLDIFFASRASSNNEQDGALPKSGKGIQEGRKSVAPVPKAPAPSKKVLGVASISDILGFNPVEVSSREKLESKDVPRKWKKFYNILVDLRKRYSQGVSNRAEEVLKRSTKEDSGDLSSYGQHMADAGSESYDRDMAFSFLSSEKEIIAEIDAAIERIKNGTYGICEVTGKPIPESRLLSVPFTRCTKEGQEIKERELKKLKTSQRASFGEILESGAENGEDAGN